MPRDESGMAGMGEWERWRVKKETSVERLETLAGAPLALIERFHQEVRSMADDFGIPAQDLLDRIAHLQAQLYREGEEAFAGFLKEAEATEQQLEERLQHLRTLKERATLLRGLLASMFRPGHPG